MKLQTTSILKSFGVTSTEKLLADLCDSTFLKLWSYPNPFKSDGKELCDVLAVFENQIKTAAGAKRYVLENPEKVFLDAKCCIPFPIPLPKENIIVHKIIVAHGAAEACKKFSTENVTGSL